MTDAQQIAERLIEEGLHEVATKDRVDALLDAGLREAVRICEEVPKTVSDPGMIGLAEMILAALKGEKA